MREVFIYSEQPTTCPFCGLRTEIILDLSHIRSQLQVHFCGSCKAQFWLENDESE